MDTSPDSDGDDAKVAKHSHRWQPPKANGLTARASETNKHTPSVAPEHDNHEFQQTHAAEAARHEVAQHEAATGAMASLEASGKRTTGRHRRANAAPAAAGVAEEGLKNRGGRRKQVPQAPSPGVSPDPPEGTVHHQHQEPLRPRQPTKHSKRGPDHCATAARSTGPQSTQRPRRASAEASASASRRLAAEAIEEEQELSRKQAKANARLDAERERGAQLGLWLGRSWCAAPQLRFDNFSSQPTSLLRNPYVVAGSLATDLDFVADSLALSAHTAFDSFESNPGTAHQVFISWFDLCWFVSPEAAVQSGPAGFAQLLVALERAGVAARSRVVREPTRPAFEFTAPPQPKMMQPRLAPSSSTASSSSPPSPPPSPPSSKSTPVAARREGPWTPDESVELIDWLAHV